MNIKNAVLIGLIVIAGMFFFYALSIPRGTPREFGGAVGQPQQPSVSAAPYESQTNSDSGVEVVAQPLDLGSSTWTFDFGINTHSGSLDVDILKSVVLADNRGDTAAPIAWDGPGPGGHHRSGTLTFNAITPLPDAITLTAKDIGGVATRTFTWQLKGQ